MSQKFITPASMETTRASQVDFTGVCESVFVRMRACSCVCVCVLQLDVIKGGFEHQQQFVSILDFMITSWKHTQIHT